LALKEAAEYGYSVIDFIFQAKKEKKQGGENQMFKCSMFNPRNPLSPITQSPNHPKYD